MVIFLTILSDVKIGYKRLLILNLFLEKREVLNGVRFKHYFRIIIIR